VSFPVLFTWGWNISHEPLLILCILYLIIIIYDYVNSLNIILYYSLYNIIYQCSCDIFCSLFSIIKVSLEFPSILNSGQKTLYSTSVQKSVFAYLVSTHTSTGYITSLVTVLGSVISICCQFLDSDNYITHWAYVEWHMCQPSVTFLWRASFRHVTPLFYYSQSTYY
jgi:hypothetical protein